VRRILLRIAIVAMCVIALIAIVAVITGKFDDTQAKILISTLAVVVYSLLAMGTSSIAQQRPLLAVLGWAACGVGLVLALLAIWIAWDGGHDGLWRALLIALVVAFTVAHASMIDARKRDSDGGMVRAIRLATTATVVLVGVLVTLACTVEGLPDSYYRALGVVGVLDVLGTVVLPIARKVQQSPPAAAGN